MTKLTGEARETAILEGAIAIQCTVHRMVSARFMAMANGDSDQAARLRWNQTSAGLRAAYLAEAEACLRAAGVIN